MDQYIGRLLDNRYEILEVIGTGGMAVVYKARCHRLNRLVAIKILKDEFSRDEEFRRRFHAEGEAVAMLSHPNIVQVYDVSSSDNANFIVMELIDGISLKQYMQRKGILNWKETLHFAIQIGKALEHAHSRGIVHRDIKPHNVMVLKNGSVKVTDFGIARMMAQSNTLTKEALGSVHYISPEQAKGGRVDNRSDIYSLGVVMYEMMSGRPPYDGESPVAVAIKHINGGAPLPSTLNPNIPGGLEQIIMHAMAGEPAQRYDSATKMLADMDEFRKDPGILFDYNVPPLEDVIRIQKPPLVLEPTPAKTTAERVEQRKTAAQGRPPQRRSAVGAGAGVRRENRRTTNTREDDRGSNVATIAIVACSAVMVLAIIIFLVVLFSNGTGTKPEMIEVPSLLGMDYETLKKDTNFQFKLQINEKKYNNEYPEGQIYNQNPAPGVSLHKGEIIVVDVSLGKEPVKITMPEIGSNWEKNDAKQALTDLGLTLNIVMRPENSDSIPKDKIIRTDPVAGTELSVGQTVTLYYSAGMEFKTGLMLDLIGQKKEDAERVLLSQNMGLDIDVEEIFDPQVAEGLVVRTEPVADAEIFTGDTITLFISKGPQLEPIPNVLNLSADSAVKLLQGEGFQNYKLEPVENEKPKDTVIELRIDGETVAPNTQVEISTTITLVVSTGPAAKTTKTVQIILPDEVIQDDPEDPDNKEYQLRVDLNGVTIHEETLPMNNTKTSISVEMTGSGVQTYIVYVNGKAAIEAEVDFTKK